MFKWLTITFIALAGFLLVLLSLGYLLKENEVATTALKHQLDEQAQQQQQRQLKRQPKYIQQRGKQQYLAANLSAAQKSQQKIIANHLACTGTKQCLVIDTQSQALGCSVAINTLGAAILLKVVANTSAQAQKSRHADNNRCPPSTHSLSAMCENNVCLLK